VAEEGLSAEEEDSTGFGPAEADESEGVHPPIEALVDRLAEVYDDLPGSDAPEDNPSSGAGEESVASAGDADDEPSRTGLFSLPDLPPPGSGKGEGPGWS